MNPSKEHASKYKRHHGDSGLAGQNYEINLCTYLLLEANTRLETIASKDKHIEEFYIASNMEGAGCLDDVILKYSYMDESGKTRNNVSFIQAKHKTAENLTLEKLFATTDNDELGILQKYHEAYRAIEKQILENKTNDPIFSTAIEDVDIIFFTTAPLGGLKMDAFKEFKKENNDFLYFTDIYHTIDPAISCKPGNSATNEGISKDTTDGPIFSTARDGGIKKHEAFKKFKEEKKYFSDFTNIYYKLDTTVSCKPSHIMESVNIMELLNNNSECQSFVTSLVDALCSGASNGNILSDYKIPILDEIINITAPGVGIIKPEFATGDIKSPFEQCFETEIKRKLSKPGLREIELTLREDYGTINENYNGKLILPYAKKYFENFLNKFKFYVNQPSESEITEFIERRVKLNFAKTDREAKEIAIIMKSKIRDWWEDASEYVDYIDRNSSVLEDSGNFSIHFNVCQPVPGFAGRENQLKQFHDLILTQESTVHVGVVHGLGGIGKTQFMRKYIQQYFSRDNVIWIDAENQNKITESFNNLVNTKLAFLKDEESDKIIKLVLEYFANRSCIFVFDNAENTEYLRKTLSFMKDFKKWQPYIAITSRDTEWESPIQTFKLDVLQIEDAIHMIKTGLNIENEREDNDARKLAETLGCYPLALQQAISFIIYERFCTDYSIKTYMDEFDSKEAEILDSGESSDIIFNDYKITTLKTWIITINKIMSDSTYGDAAMLVFRIMAYCAPNAIHTTMFYRLPNVTEQQVDEGVNLLVKYSMVNADVLDNNETQLSVHRLVQDVTRIKLKGTDKEIDVLENTLIIFDKNITRLTLDHALVVWMFASENENLVKRFGHNFGEIINTLHGESRFQEAEDFSVKSRATLMKFFRTADHPTIIDVDHRTCKVLLNLSKYKLASKLAEDILSRLPKNNTEKILKINYLRALLVSRKGEYDKSLDMLINLLPQCVDPGQPTSIKVKESIARIYKRKGHYRKSIDMLKEILETLETAERNHEENFSLRLLFKVQNSIAFCHFLLWECNEALAIYQQVLERGIKAYGETNAIALRTLNDMSLVYIRQEKYTEALKILKKTLKIKIKIYKNECCASVLTTRDNIASLYLSLTPDKYKKGLALLRGVSEGKEELFGANHEKTIHAVAKVAFMLYKMNNFNEALEIFQKAYDRLLKTQDDKTHPLALQIYTKIANTHNALGHKHRALKMLNEVLPVLVNSENYGQDNPDTLKVTYHKASILGDLGYTNDALDMLYKIQFKIRKSQLGKDNSFCKHVVNKIKTLEDVKLKSLSMRSFILRIIKQIATLLVVYVLYNLFIDYF